MLRTKIGAITQNTLLPISLVIVIITVASYIGALATKVEAIQKLDSPSRNEFNQICKQLTEIQAGVNSINNYLLPKK